MERLEGRTAVVTGDGSGTGGGLAHACRAAGMRVVLAGVEEDEAERVAADVRALGGEALAVRADVSSFGAVEELAARAYEALGEVHLLCNNAGVLAVSPLAEAPEADWEWTLGVNLMGPVHGVRAFVPGMRAQGGEAHVADTASVAGVYAIGGLPLGVCTASKFALVGYPETLRAELAPDGIGVPVLCPGGVATRIAEAGRNRPRAPGGPGAPPPDGIGAARRGRLPPAMDPREVGERVLAGVRANRLCVFTHAGRRAPAGERHRRTVADYDALG